ncbi:hypothetical protein GH714_024369 [Hevea brasiliensis]|uniref:Uncharacterized protein n=1 Tax=Hevea brasiliensis TaxID=3981 RepID=A0A6A6LB00_HEVBR|nr:hypothetical protein GH714_024369 [Hevea brasiliensis]
MAVQAQYPSNVLLLNRNGQEGHDYSLQPQPGRFLDQSHMLFTNGGANNPRKRGREVSAAAATGEQLRRTLAEKKQRHYRALLSTVEESIARRLKEKEAEVEKATRRNAELEARAAQLSVEAQVWQAKARAQEATAASLQAQLQQAIMSGGVAAQDNRRGDDGGLGCSGE